MCASFVATFNCVMTCSQLSFYTKVNRTCQKMQELMRNKSKKLEPFKKMKFILPVQESSHERSLAASTTEKRKIAENRFEEN